MTEEQSTNTGTTHVWPYNIALNPDAKPISDERESDVWDELRDLTLDNDVRGDVVCITHADYNYENAKELIQESFQEGACVIERFVYYTPIEYAQNVAKPSELARTYFVRNLGTGEIKNQTTNPALPRRQEMQKKLSAFSLKNNLDALQVIETYRNHQISALVLWAPSADDLKYLPMVREKCADMKVYIFHGEWHDEKWGVEREAGGQTAKQTATIEWADTIKRASTQWLIPEFLPLCEVTAFSGEMDTRKSTTVIDIAAKGSSGGGPEKRWFNNTPFEGQPFSTIYAGTEDSFSTVQNRFIAAGGNPKALGRLPVEVKRERPTPDGVEVVSIPLSFDEHLNVLREAIIEANKTALYPIGLLINDPLIAFFGDKNFNKAQDCQDILHGQKKLCEELKISIINLMHYNKTQGASAKEKTGGSQRLIEAHRQAWSFTLVDETDKESSTLISPIKKNLLRVAQSYEITTVSTPVEWEDEGVTKHDVVGVVQFVRLSDQTADGQLQEKAAKDKSKQMEMRDDILDVLKEGAVAPGVVYANLRQSGSDSTILRAVNKLIKAGKVRN